MPSPIQELKNRARTFSRTIKQVTVELIPTKDEYHLLVGLKYVNVPPTKTPEENGASQKALEKVAKGRGGANPPLSR